MKVKNNEIKLLKLSDVGYHGKPSDTLTKKELQLAFLEVVQQLCNCDYTQRKNLILRNKD